MRWARKLRESRREKTGTLNFAKIKQAYRFARSIALRHAVRPSQRAPAQHAPHEPAHRIAHVKFGAIEVGEPERRLPRPPLAQEMRAQGSRQQATGQRRRQQDPFARQKHVCARAFADLVALVEEEDFIGVRAGEFGLVNLAARGLVPQQRLSRIKAPLGYRDRPDRVLGDGLDLSRADSIAPSPLKTILTRKRPAAAPGKLSTARVSASTTRDSSWRKPSCADERRKRSKCSARRKNPSSLVQSSVSISPKSLTRRSGIAP